jgi:hypothetical protein
MPRPAVIEWARLVITGIVIAGVPALSTRAIASAGTAAVGTVDIFSPRGQRRGESVGAGIMFKQSEEIMIRSNLIGS